MAANLLSEFEDFYNPGTSKSNPATFGSSIAQSKSKTTQEPTRSSYDLLGEDLGSTQPVKSNEPNIAEEDDFGDFETAQSTPAPATAPATAPPAKLVSPPPPRIKEISQQPLPVRKPRDSGEGLTKPRNENVLFDAEDEESSDEDDFGAFEGGPTTAAVDAPRTEAQNPQSSNVQASLIDFDGPTDNGVHVIQQSPPKRNPADVQVKNEKSTFAKRNPLTTTSKTFKPTSTKQPIKAKPPAAPEIFDDAGWDDFEPQPQPQTNRNTKPQTFDGATSEISQPTDLISTTPPINNTSTDLPFRLDPLLNSSIPNQPQSNIPPPTILLSIFPTIIDRATTQFFDPLSTYTSTDASLTTIVYTNSQVQTYLQSLLTISTTLARIIAGRKHRWKRDKLLAQSMSISQASSGGRSGGMKLAGVDKAENAREERDVEDAVRAWRGILGRVRSAVKAARNVGTVPEVKETYVVRTATEREGALTAPKACILCGLKRNERVQSVDTGEVNDNFGEWWVEHWGHVGCARFWGTYEEGVRGR